MNEFYYAKFHKENNELTIIEPTKIIKKSEITNLDLKDSLIIGNAKKIAQEIFEKEEQTLNISQTKDEATSFEIALYALKNAENQKSDLTPDYLRAPKISKKKK